MVLDPLDERVHPFQARVAAHSNDVRADELRSNPSSREKSELSPGTMKPVEVTHSR